MATCIKKCIICGKEFKSKSNRGLYCSEKCRNIAKSKEALKHVGEEWKGMKIEDMFLKNGREYAVLKCRNCGKKFSCRYDSLQRGQKSCGCDQSKPSERAEILGHKFGRLTPVKLIGSRNKNMLYLCKCDCGGEIKATAKDLKYGSVTSCGCKNREHLKNADREAWGFVDGTNKRTFENETMWINNTSGVRGVSWSRSNNGWYAYIRYKGKSYSLGTFKELHLAAYVRKEAEKAVLEDRFEEWIKEYKK